MAQASSDALPTTMAPADKRAVYGWAAADGWRPALLETLVFVLEPVPEEVEASRDLVTPDDLPHLVAAYWRLSGRRQRTALVHLLADQDSPLLEPVWLDLLRIPDDGAGTSLHAAKALALARLDGDVDTFDRYFGDYAACVLAAARRWSRGG